MLWKYFQSCMYSFKENWEINLRICHIASLHSIRSCLQFHWNRKYFSSAVLRLRATIYGSVTWFPFVWWGNVNRTDSSRKDFSLVGSFFFYICCNLPVAQNILPRQQIFYSEICFFISYILLVLQHLGIFVTVMQSNFTAF